MSTDTLTREEQNSALDAFATKIKEGTELVSVETYAPPVERHYGSMIVPVRRDPTRVLAEIKALAAAAGEEWYYRWPVKNRKTGTTEWVEGHSIKLANAVALAYGNCEIEIAKPIDYGDGWLINARFIDLEKGFSLIRSFKQRKSGGKMGDDAERREDIAFQIGQSKAIRNVIINGLQSYADFALREARSALVDKIGGNIEAWRQRAVERVSARVELARVEAVVGRVAKDWLAPDIAKVIAMMTSVVDGMASLDDTFPPLKAATSEAATREALDRFSSAPNPSGAGNADAPSQHPSPRGAAGASAPFRKEAIDKLIGFASDPALSVEERLAELDNLMPHWHETLGAAGVSEAFRHRLFKTAAEVAKNHVTAADARRLLEG